MRERSLPVCLANNMLAFLGGSATKTLPGNAGCNLHQPRMIPGSGTSPGDGDGNLVHILA